MKFRPIAFATIVLFVAALIAPAFEYQNGFGVTGERLGYQALVLAGFGAVLGWSNGIWVGLLALSSLLGNLFFLIGMKRIVRLENTSNSRMLKWLGLVLVVNPVSLIQELSHVKNSRGSAQGVLSLHSGYYLWFAALILSWILLFLNERARLTTPRYG